MAKRKSLFPAYAPCVAGIGKSKSNGKSKMPRVIIYGREWWGWIANSRPTMIEIQGDTWTNPGNVIVDQIEIAKLEESPVTSNKDKVTVAKKPDSDVKGPKRGKCPECKGKGFVTKWSKGKKGERISYETVCGRCGGDGEVWK
jgi:hypothetical protein